MRWPLSIGLALMLLAGCTSTPENRYYTLSVEPPATAAPARPPASGLAIAALHLPGITDRPQLVVRIGAQTVDIREFDRWAEPLDQMVPHILARDLALRLGAPSGAVQPRRLFVTIDEFMADASGRALLTGRWWVLAPDEDVSRKVERSFSLGQPVAADQSTQVAAAMSTLLGRLADEIAGNREGG